MIPAMPNLSANLTGGTSNAETALRASGPNFGGFDTVTSGRPGVPAWAIGLVVITVAYLYFRKE